MLDTKKKPRHLEIILFQFQILDVFSKPIRETLIEGGTEIFVPPITPISEVTSEIRIQCPTFEDYFIALPDTRLVVKAKIMEKDSTTGALSAVPQGTDVSVVNLLGASMWSKINVHKFA